ncbi:TssQ family T6SS-associated lipoprotein [Pusillimonas sp. MFBS29]|uniref:TssQ family T6SS-associated lipoprotein n=1 Tax=Pusillimonas sp. MFBS29 TaxID=2886690 RepID=UPI001D0F9332|nr:TssQ family T6SS-associated lipoprotein [Pusillimonas sp. MFBS29]MCC2596542.1 TssQ family T6SS-associated lipoprotein [Pusillimonas sp. MFBS29]
MKRNLLTPLCTLLAAMMLSACAHSPDPTAATSEQRQALADLELDYSAGNYAKVAQTVGLSVELQSAPPTVRMQALKLQAFSYCLQEKAAQCERSFERLLKQHPDFELTESERNHPMWGPAYTRARDHAAQSNTVASSQ